MQLVFSQKDNERIYTTSRVVAKEFGKEHFNVLASIKTLLEHLNSDPEIALKFSRSSYKDSYGRDQEEYELNKAGFIILVSHFTTKKATIIKSKFVDAFIEMEDKLNNMGIPEGPAQRELNEALGSIMADIDLLKSQMSSIGFKNFPRNGISFKEVKRRYFKSIPDSVIKKVFELESPTKIPYSITVPTGTFGASAYSESDIQTISNHFWKGSKPLRLTKCYVVYYNPAVGEFKVSKDSRG